MVVLDNIRLNWTNIDIANAYVKWDDVRKIIHLTLEEYNALTEKDNNAVYVVTWTGQWWTYREYTAWENITISDSWVISATWWWADWANKSLSNLNSDWEARFNAKQNVISDLSDIRRWAARWDTALQSYSETDPTVPSHVKNITSSNISDWNNKMDNPSGWTAWQVLTKTSSWVEWKDSQGWTWGWISSDTITWIWTWTQEEYNRITEKSSTILYFVKE